jgi:hypothetical protein
VPPGSPGTNQLIGRGAYAGTFTITPSPANAGGTTTCSAAVTTNCCPAAANVLAGFTCITDAQIQTELTAQIVAGTLPAPDENSFYMTYFPPKYFLTDSGGGYSCRGGGFCGYHSTFKDAAREFYYGVMPDHGPDSGGCDVGCGPTCRSGDTACAFANLTSTSGHEFEEAITDAEVGLQTDPTTGWYDPGDNAMKQNGEIGDMCNASTLVAGFNVQNNFSNVVAATDMLHACVVSRVAANDFSISMAANRRTLAGSTSVTVPIATAITSGTPGTLALSFSVLPAHVTGSLDSTSILPPTGAVLTLTADSSATTVQDAVVQIKAVDGSNIHTAGLLLNVVPTGTSTNDFSLNVTAPPGGTTLAPGGHAAWSVSAATVAGAPANIALKIGGALPTGVTAAFSAATIQPAGSSALTLTAAANAPAVSNATFTVQGTDSGGILHTSPGQVSISTPATANDFSLSLSPASATVARGQSIDVTVASSVVSGTAESIALSATVLPSGVSASFAPASITAGASATLTLSASSSAALASNTSFTVTGSAASAIHNAAGSITVAGSTGPTVAVTHPTDGATVSGPVEIDAAATPGPGATLLQIELLVDGAVAGSSTASPAQGFWQSTEATEGPHVIKARAVDSNGGSTLSAPVTVTVNNASAPPAKHGGGCAGSGAGLSALLGLLALRRRRRVT